MVRKKNPGKKLEKVFSQGEANRLIDSSLHPLYRQTELLRLVDGLAHGLLERNPRMSLKKFIKFNLPEILEKALNEVQART